MNIIMQGLGQVPNECRAVHVYHDSIRSDVPSCDAQTYLNSI